MKNLEVYALCLLIFVASIGISQAQKLARFKIVDRHCKDCTEMTFGNNGFELKDIHDSKEEIEIRLLTNNEHISRTLTVIKGSKGKLKAAYYSHILKCLCPWKERILLRD